MTVILSQGIVRGVIQLVMTTKFVLAVLNSHKVIVLAHMDSLEVMQVTIYSLVNALPFVHRALYLIIECTLRAIQNIDHALDLSGKVLYESMEVTDEVEMR